MVLRILIRVLLGVGLSVLLMIVAFIFGVGAVSLVDTKVVPKTSSDVAAWAQAAFAALAIFASAWLALHVQSRSEKTARRQAAEVAFEIAAYAEGVLADARERLDSCQKIIDVANRAVPFDETALEDLLSVLSDVSLQDIRDAAITRELILLRKTVRIFKRNVAISLDDSEPKDETVYEVFFRAMDRDVATSGRIRQTIKDLCERHGAVLHPSDGPSHCGRR